MTEFALEDHGYGVNRIDVVKNIREGEEFKMNCYTGRANGRRHADSKAPVLPESVQTQV